jgi:hypothetical protein
MNLHNMTNEMLWRNVTSTFASLTIKPWNGYCNIHRCRKVEILQLLHASKTTGRVTMHYYRLSYHNSTLRNPIGKTQEIFVSLFVSQVEMRLRSHIRGIIISRHHKLPREMYNRNYVARRNKITCTRMEVVIFCDIQHHAISQKTANFITTAVRTSNPT